MFKNSKNNLDEMQENKLLHIEKNGCWFAFWALLASLVIQTAVSRENLIERLAGEWIVFMCLALYIGVACIKNGIWDRKLKADPKTNLLTSLIAGVATGIITAVINYMEFQIVEAAIWCVIINFFFVSIICFVALTLCTMVYKKRLNKMEEQYEE